MPTPRPGRHDDAQQLSLFDQPPPMPRQASSAGPAPTAMPPAAVPQPTVPHFQHPRAQRSIALAGHQVGYEFRRARRRSIGFVVGTDGLSVPPNIGDAIRMFPVLGDLRSAHAPSSTEQVSPDDLRRRAHDAVAELGHQGLGRTAAGAVVQGDVSAVPVHGPCDRGTDPPRCTRDEDPPAGEHVSSPPARR